MYDSLTRFDYFPVQWGSVVCPRKIPQKLTFLHGYGDEQLHSFSNCLAQSKATINLICPIMWKHVEWKDQPCIGFSISWLKSFKAGQERTKA